MTEQISWRPGPGGVQRATVSRASRPTTPPVTFLTVAEVAAQARVSKMTIYRLIHSGELRSVRIGRSFRVSDRAAAEFLQRPAVDQP